MNGRSRLAVAAVLSSMALVVLDASVVHVALPTIGDALGARPSQTVLIVTAYQAALVMALLPMGALGERLGYRRVFAAGVAAFVAASVCCALAPSLAWLLAARFVQGLGGAAVMALGVALLRVSVGPARLGSAIGWNALTVALTSAAGPTIGAAVLSLAPWPWLFAINLPLGALALLASLALPAPRPQATRFDAVSAALNGLMFGTLILGAELAPRSPGATVALLFGGGCAAIVLFRREAGAVRPLVPIDLLRQPSFRLSVIASVCCFAGQTAGLVATPFLLQQVMGRAVVEAGALMAIWPLSVAVAATIAGRLSDRVSTGALCAAGAAAVAAGLLALSVLPASAPLPWLLAALAAGGAGFGLFQTPNNRALFMSAPPDRGGAAGGAQGTARLTGQTAGAVLVTLCLAAAPVELALRIVFASGAGLALAAALVSGWRVRGRTPVLGAA